MLSFCSHDLPHSLGLIKFIFGIRDFAFVVQETYLSIESYYLVQSLQTNKQTNKRLLGWLVERQTTSQPYKVPI